MISVKGSQSEKNLITAFVNESGARNKYIIYSQQALQEGYLEISKMFQKMADNEMEHSKVWFQIINQEITTIHNLKNAALSENDEWKHMYPNFASKAREEGFEDLALMFERVASIESNHERTFTEALLQLQSNEEDVVDEKKEHKNQYCCIFCGYMSQEKLETCCVCSAKDAFTVVS